MDVKSINTAGWSKPKKDSVLRKIISDEDEIDSLREDIHMPNPKDNESFNHSATTIEWISTWRKITN